MDNENPRLSTRDAQVDDACSLLGIDTPVDRARLDATYLELVECHNPDKIAPESRLLAMRKLIALTAAFAIALTSLDGST